MPKPKVVVIGSGIGGLTSATLLQNNGYQVTVLESQVYPGGCASTFTRNGYRFDSGATVVGGFQTNGPHTIVREKLKLDWPIKRFSPAWVTHLPDRSVALTETNHNMLEMFPESEAFWQHQQKIANVAWELSAQGLPWPPGDSTELLKLLRTGIENFTGISQILPFVIMSVRQWLRLYGLHKNPAFVRLIDSQLLISAQTTSEHVNALYGATALDLPRQGVYHIRGGIGGIAETLVKRLEALGGEILYRHRVTQIAMRNNKAIGVYFQHGRHGKQQTLLPADFVIANTTPWNLNALLQESSPRQLRIEAKRTGIGWGAFVLHLGVEDAVFPADFPDHHQIIRSMHGPLGETESIFLSLSPRWDASRAPQGHRAMTVTTHTNTTKWWNLLQENSAQYEERKEQYTGQILNALESILPDIRQHLKLLLPGTPVTYNFYTDRFQGAVGGFPQTSLFKARGPRTGISNIRLVGDSVFPGQSTAGVTLGAMRVAEDVQNHLAVEQVPSESTLPYVRQGYD